MNEKLSNIEIGRNDITEEILALRQQLPVGMGASPEAMASLAWEMEDDEAAAFAYNVADSIRNLKNQ